VYERRTTRAPVPLDVVLVRGSAPVDAAGGGQLSLVGALREIHAQVSRDGQVLKGPLLGIIHDAGQP